MLTKQSHVALTHFLPFIRKTKGSLVTLYDHLQQVEPRYHILSDQSTHKKISYQSLSNEVFIDEHLKKDILRLTQLRTVRFKTGTTTFTLEIHHQKESLDRFIQTLMYVLSFVHMLAPHKVKDIHMKYYLLDVKRVLDGDTFFDKEEVNGGACWSAPDECSITVWRKEEVLKVSIHELIHGLSYDYKQDTSDIIRFYQERYGITSPKMNTFEAYTEIWAELLHCYMISKLSDKHSYDLFSANVGVETAFSELQANKVFELLKQNKDVNKETNVTAYYLIKLELWLNSESFLQRCIHTNQGIIKMNDKEQYLRYLQGLPKLITGSDHKVTQPDKVTNKYLKETTRMTCLEIALF
jgi:hypothetical protein